MCGGSSDGLRGPQSSIRRFKEELPAHPVRMNVLAINGSPSGAGGVTAVILRPHGWVLRHLLKQGEAQDVLDAARRAGRELVEGDMSAETLAAVSREVVTLEECVWMMNE